MASQKNAETIAGRMAQTTMALKGTREAGEGLNLGDMEEMLENGLTAAQQSLDECGNAKSAAADQRAALRGAFAALRAFITLAMTAFKLMFGTQWNGKWEVLNLPPGTVRVPRSNADMLQMAQRIHSYLVANPTKEMADQGLTAIIAAALTAAVENAQFAVNSAKVKVRNSIDVRTLAFKLLGQNSRYCAPG